MLKRFVIFLFIIQPLSSAFAQSTGYLFGQVFDTTVENGLKAANPGDLSFRYIDSDSFNIHDYDGNNGQFVFKNTVLLRNPRCEGISCPPNDTEDNTVGSILEFFHERDKLETDPNLAKGKKFYDYDTDGKRGFTENANKSMTHISTNPKKFPQVIEYMGGVDQLGLASYEASFQSCSSVTLGVSAEFGDDNYKISSSLEVSNSQCYTDTKSVECYNAHSPNDPGHPANVYMAANNNASVYQQALIEQPFRWSKYRVKLSPQTITGPRLNMLSNYNNEKARLRQECSDLYNGTVSLHRAGAKKRRAKCTFNSTIEFDSLLLRASQRPQAKCRYYDNNGNNGREIGQF